ncbi:MAG: M23 family metallopeptidase [Chloroflexi bacterium]|nr:M23 family metallopeptidase [Chloroflexota bacterium]
MDNNGVTHYPLLRPAIFFLLAAASLGCGLISAVENPHTLAGVAYWAAATTTSVPTETRFLGTTTPVYADTPVPVYITTTPQWTTVTPMFAATPTPYWVTTTPVYITETPQPPVTTTPGLPIIGFTTPVPQTTPHYRVGSFYMHSDVTIGGPNNLVLRLIDWQTAPSPRQPEASFYYFTFRLTNHGAVESIVPLSDLLFIRASHGQSQPVTGRWQPGNEPLLAANLPLADSQLLSPLQPQETRQVVLGITAPTGQVQEIGLLTNWRQTAVRPIWFLLTPDPTGPHQDAEQPPPPTPIVLGDGDPGGPTDPGTGGGMWPTTGFITRGFGCNAYYTGIDGAGYGCPPEQPWFHNGVDIANTAGTLVWSPINGTLHYAGPHSSGPDCAHIPGSEAPHEGLGNYQRLGDGETLHYLGHLRGFLLTAGGVSAGQNIAEMGSTGCSTGSHLHWTMYQHGNLVDPAGWAE